MKLTMLTHLHMLNSADFHSGSQLKTLKKICTVRGHISSIKWTLNKEVDRQLEDYRNKPTYLPFRISFVLDNFTVQSKPLTVTVSQSLP